MLLKVNIWLQDKNFDLTFRYIYSYEISNGFIYIGDYLKATKKLTRNKSSVKQLTIKITGQQINILLKVKYLSTTV